MIVVTKLDEDVRSRFVEHENVILDIKEALGGGISYSFQQVGDNIKKIAVLEHQLYMMRTAGDDQYSKTMVVGGIGDDINIDQAEQWVRDQIQRYSKANALDMFAKGDYHGMLFCKFESQVSRDSCTASLRRASP